MVNCWLIAFPVETICCGRPPDWKWSCTRAAVVVCIWWTLCAYLLLNTAVAFATGTYLRDIGSDRYNKTTCNLENITMANSLFPFYESYGACVLTVSVTIGNKTEEKTNQLEDPEEPDPPIIYTLIELADGHCTPKSMNQSSFGKKKDRECYFDEKTGNIFLEWVGSRGIMNSMGVFFSVAIFIILFPQILYLVIFLLKCCGARIETDNPPNFRRAEPRNA
ncbi:hypothetical protein BLNAU_14016 [Blattamonas nauphoetae]|uniref:Uncharacterized protein n=1 Tax=Blattamonas nauphoetae TaxID=2049346 RepID=A0ABQ9XLM8_9EUKA|nr:hypothetical protein BLNAU_14016 [Blattamonas nauphoetae]